MELSPLRPDQTDDGALYDKIDADKVDADRMARHTRILVLAAIALLLVGGIAIVTRNGTSPSAPAASPLPTLSGEVVLEDIAATRFAAAEVGAKCEGGGGYADLRTGGQILLLDGAGTTIGTGSLGAGRFEPRLGGCAFSFSVPAAPKADFYSVKVNHRGGPTYSYADMQARNWQVELTIG